VWYSARLDFDRPAVRDLADQDVLEAVRRLAADRRTLLPRDQVA
jgi:uncharacterized protein YqfA (UPF0365 family)